MDLGLLIEEIKSLKVEIKNLSNEVNEMKETIYSFVGKESFMTVVDFAKKKGRSYNWVKTHYAHAIFKDRVLKVDLSKI